MSFKKIDCNLTQKFSEYPDFGVLNGVKVFVSGTAIAGPFAGCLMAEMDNAAAFCSLQHHHFGSQ